MPSTYSNLKIQLMATGENNTTWGDVTNLNLGTAIEEAIVGSADVTFSSGNVTLTLTDSNTSQTARNVRLRCTGTTGGSTRNLVVPSIEKPYIIQNDCADSIVVKTAAGTGVTVPAGKTMWVVSDGINVVDVVTHLSGLTLSTALSVSSGGTGATTLTGYVKGNGTSALTASATIPTSDLSGSINVSNGGTGQTSYTDGQLLIGNSTGNTLTKATLTQGAGMTITNGAGSIALAVTNPLTDFASALGTASPNATVPIASLTATNGSYTDIDIALIPKGSGALTAHVADNFSIGGNKRGAHATDWQRVRTLASQVAFGGSSTISGGGFNSATGVYSTVSGGQSNTAGSTICTVGGGQSNTTNGTGSTIAGGYSNTANANYSTVAGGSSNTASANFSTVPGGANNTASGIYSIAVGYLATTRGIQSAMAHASGGFTTTAGQAQAGRYVVRASTTDATVTYATADGAVISSSNIAVMPNNSTYTFDIFVTARRTDLNGDNAGYRLTGVVSRDANAASTAIVGSVTKTVIAETSPAWDVDVFVSTSIGGFTVQVTGEAGEAIRWVAVINTVEVTA